MYRSRIYSIVASVVSVLLALLIANERERVLLGNSFLVVLAVECLALPISVALALFIARTNAPGRTWVVWLLASLLFIPLHLQLTGWDAACGKLGWWTLWWSQRSAPILQGFRAVVILHALYAIPWGTLLMAGQFRAGRRVWEEQALMEGTWAQVFCRVTWPQCREGVLLAAVWIMLLTVGDMTVTNIYLVRTYTENVYSHFAASGDLTAVVPHALPLVFVTLSLLLLAAATWPTRGNERQPEEHYCWSLGKWQGIVSSGVLLFVSWLVLVPMVNLVVQAGLKITLHNGQPTRVWSWEKLVEILRLVPYKFAPEFLSTVELASSAMLLSVIAGGWLAWLAQRSRWTSSIAWFIAALGLATPAPLLGVAVIWLLNQPQLPFCIYLYDRTLLPPLLAIFLRTGALSYLMLERAWRSLDPDVLAAVELEGASRWQVFQRIALPQRWGTVLAVSVITFALAAGDLAASLLTLPPGFFTISQRMFGLVHSGVDDQVAGLGLWCWCGFLGVTFLWYRTGWGQIRQR